MGALSKLLAKKATSEVAEGATKALAKRAAGNIAKNIAGSVVENSAKSIAKNLVTDIVTKNVGRSASRAISKRVSDTAAKTASGGASENFGDMAKKLGLSKNSSVKRALSTKNLESNSAGLSPLSQKKNIESTTTLKNLLGQRDYRSNHREFGYSPTEVGLDDATSNSLSKALDTTGARRYIPVSKSTLNSVLKTNIETPDIQIQHATRLPAVNSENLSVAPSGAHRGVLYASPANSDVPALGADSYEKMLYGRTGDYGVLDLSKKDAREAFADEFDKEIEQLTSEEINTDPVTWYNIDAVKDELSDLSNDIRNGETERLHDGYGILKKLAKKYGIGWIKGKSALEKDELVAITDEAVKNAGFKEAENSVSGTAMPVGTKITFENDGNGGISIKSVKKPGSGKGWWADNEKNPHVANPQMDMGTNALRGQVMYHTSPNKFTKFDDLMLGNNTGYGNTALGHFVTPDRDYSAKFGDINSTGAVGNTMELLPDIKNPITHPIGASYKYSGDELDDIVKNYLKAVDNEEGLEALEELAHENGTSLYDEYMNTTLDSDPWENAAEERQILKKKGYDAVEIVEGLKKDLVDGSTDESPVSSYAVLDGDKLRPLGDAGTNVQASATEPDSTMGTISTVDQSSLSYEKAMSEIDDSISKITSGDMSEGDYKKVDELRLEKARIASGINKTDIKTTLEEIYDKYYGDLLYAVLGDYDDESVRKYLSDAVGAFATKSGGELYDEAKDVFWDTYRAVAKRDGDIRSYNVVNVNLNNPETVRGINSLAFNGGKSPKRADAATSASLGISPSSTVITNRPYGLKSSERHARGDYTGGVIGVDSTTNDERVKSTTAHERLHAFQGARKVGGYDERVYKAYDELHNDLDGLLNSKDYYDDMGDYATYFANANEQEARAFQEYLGRKGVIEYRPAWGQDSEFNPGIDKAFDKFIAKLQKLSKEGVALPATIGALFGLYALDGDDVDNDE